MSLGAFSNNDRHRPAPDGKHNVSPSINHYVFSIVSTWGQPSFLLGIRVAHLFSFLNWTLFSFFFVFVLCLVCQISPESLDYPFLNAPSVFSSVNS